MSSRNAARSARSARNLAKSTWEQEAREEAFNLLEVLEGLDDPFAASDDEELARLFDEDQADRLDGTLTAGIGERDRSRRTRGLAKLLLGEVRSPRDFYHLAMLLQHGGMAEHYHLGHELARRDANAGLEAAGSASEPWSSCVRGASISIRW
jgi:hypothetical protein